jgi:hypothetical protein
MDELTEIADRLYAGPADGFTDARNAAAREVDDKALAAQVKKLKKPSVAAWPNRCGQPQRPSTATSCGR